MTPDAGHTKLNFNWGEICLPTAEEAININIIARSPHNQTEKKTKQTNKRVHSTDETRNSPTSAQ